jgi:hypothetical protein
MICIQGAGDLPGIPDGDVLNQGFFLLILQRILFFQKPTVVHQHQKFGVFVQVLTGLQIIIYY